MKLQQKRAGVPATPKGAPPRKRDAVCNGKKLRKIARVLRRDPKFKSLTAEALDNLARSLL